MTDNLIARLRAWIRGDVELDLADIAEAADTLERYKAALEQIMEAGTFQPHSDDPPSYDYYADIARSALNGEPSNGIL